MARDGDGRSEGDREYWAKRGERRTNGAPLGAVVNMLPTPRGDAWGAEKNRAGRTGTGPTLNDAISLLPTPKASDGAGNYYLPGVAAHPEVWGKYADAIALWESIIGVPAPTPTELGPRGSPRLNPALPEWMMGLRPGLLTDRLGRSDALKAAGNGVVPLAAAAAWKLLTAD